MSVEKLREEIKQLAELWERTANKLEDVEYASTEVLRECVADVRAMLMRLDFEDTQAREPELQGEADVFVRWLANSVTDSEWHRYDHSALLDGAVKRAREILARASVGRDPSGPTPEKLTDDIACVFCGERLDLICRDGVHSVGASVEGGPNE